MTKEKDWKQEIAITAYYKLGYHPVQIGEIHKAMKVAISLAEQKYKKAIRKNLEEFNNKILPEELQAIFQEHFAEYLKEKP